MDVASQAPLSLGFPSQEYWSGLPFPSPGDLPNPGIEVASPALVSNSLPLSYLGSLSRSMDDTYRLRPTVLLLRWVVV